MHKSELHIIVLGAILNAEAMELPIDLKNNLSCPPPFSLYQDCIWHCSCQQTSLGNLAAGPSADWY